VEKRLSLRGVDPPRFVKKRGGSGGELGPAKRARGRKNARRGITDNAVRRGGRSAGPRRTIGCKKNQKKTWPPARKSGRVAPKKIQKKKLIAAPRMGGSVRSIMHRPQRNRWLKRGRESAEGDASGGRLCGGENRSGKKKKDQPTFSWGEVTREPAERALAAAKGGEGKRVHAKTDPADCIVKPLPQGEKKRAHPRGGGGTPRRQKGCIRRKK